MAALVSAPAHPAVPVTEPLVPFQRPQPPVPEAIMAYYRLSQEAGFYSNGGPCSRLLSSRLSHHLGGDTFAIPVGNCTVGLMAALRAACGMPAGERRAILTPAYTF